MGNISLRIILFSVLAKYRLIGRVWMDLPIYLRSSFGSSEPDLCFGLVWRGLGVALGTPFLWVWRVG